MITAEIISIKTEGGRIRALVNYSDGDSQGYLFDSNVTIQDIQLSIADALKSKNQISEKLSDLQSSVGSQFSISEDGAQLNITKDEAVSSIALTEPKAQPSNANPALAQ